MIYILKSSYLKALYNHLLVSVYMGLILLCIGYNSLKASSVITYNIVNVPVTKLDFIFIETSGTINDSFVKEINFIHTEIQKYSVTSTNNVIMFLDDNPPDYRTTTNILVREKEIDKAFLEQKYGTPYLRSQRRVLVGTFVFSNPSIEYGGKLKVYRLENLKVQAFQSVVLEENDELKLYNINDRVYDRTIMLDYMGRSKNEANNSYLGMIEMFDNYNNVYTFMALPGIKTDFIARYNLSSLLIKDPEFVVPPAEELELSRDYSNRLVEPLLGKSYSLDQPTNPPEAALSKGRDNNLSDQSFNNTSSMLNQNTEQMANQISTQPAQTSDQSQLP
ncbi:hypothetical protein ABSA28_00061 [Candidatus Hepatincolaceae symbiont of Richtersius coronifer]